MTRLLTGGAIGVLAVAVALLGIAFVRQPGLGTFADDSVSYLVMGQVLSPWREAPAAVAAVFPHEAFHPPLYPLLLGLSGAAYDFELAHALSALLVAGCLPLAYVLGVRWLEDRRAALAATLVLALLPVLWISMRGILSEPLYALLLLATLLALEPPPASRGRLVLIAALLAALVLTRTAGAALALGYGAWALSRRDEPVRRRLAFAAPAVISLLMLAAWLMLRPAPVLDTNADLALDRLGAWRSAESPVAALGASVARQAQAMAEAWAGSLLLFWVEGQAVRPLLAGALGAFALAGLVLRLARGKADAWLSAAYLATYLAWPLYDQMTRFLFPLVPVLVLYAFASARELTRRWASRPLLGPLLLAVLAVSLAAPGLAFMHQRFRTPGPQAAIVDWYRTPDLAAARARAQVHLDLAEDMEAIRATAKEHERVMWVAPAYIALLADRHAVPAPSARLAPEEYRAAVRRAAPELVLLTRFHPRDTIRDEAWRTGVAALSGQGEVVHARADGGRPAAYLVRLGPPR